jgi:DNA-binding transcriptional regulator LsrR (DeoR family)
VKAGRPRKEDCQRIWQRNKEIRDRYRSGAKQGELAGRFGLSRSVICKTVSGKFS